MEKNTILAIVLSLMVILGYQYIVPHPKAGKPSQEKNLANPDTTSSPSPDEPVEQATAAAKIKPKKVPASKIYTLENDRFVIAFDSLGARIKSIRLKEYFERDAAKKPIELINIGSEAFYPLGLSDKDDDLLTAVYDVRVTEDDSGASIVFTKSLPELQLIKKFRVDRDGYSVKMEVSWQNNSGATVNIPTYSVIWEPDVYLNLKEDKTDIIRVVANINDKIRSIKAPKIKGTSFNLEYENKDNKLSSENVRWLAIGSKYFISAIIPRNIPNCFAKLEKLPSADVKAPRVRIAIVVPSASISPNKTVSNNFEIYLGPKEISYLQAFNNKMEDNIDFGFFGSFSKFLLVMLRQINNYVGNFGWSIIILSVMIKLVTYPLAHKSFTSMKKMQTITPMMNEIKEKYKGNQQKVNQEIMALYKRHKVNPLGGCLPMLIQLPVLFGLFNTLRSAIELRGAPFMFWFTDLSQKDPYFVLPVLMGITMFLQQKMTPVTDPKQAKMMYFMPLIMTFLFINLSAGLFLYFIVSNILTIAQQYIINQKTT